MYSYKDRIRAVKLYLKLRKCSGATIRQLGYPTKNALKSWHQEFEKDQDLATGYVRLRQRILKIRNGGPSRTTSTMTVALQEL